MISLEDKALIDQALQISPQMLSDYNFTNLWMWDSLRDYQLLEKDGFLLIKFKEKGEQYFLFPLGQGSKKKLLQKLIAEEKPFTMRAIPEEALQEFSSLDIIPETDRFDYLYNFEDLLILPGNSYQPKRNLIHQFERDYAYTFEPITKDNLNKVVKAEKRWFQEYEETKENIQFEHEAIMHALEAFFHLNIKGGILFVKDDVAAYSFAEYIHPEVLLIHAEKAFLKYHGSYQMINQQMLMHLPQVPFVNREEDLGNENLHKVKESYHPVKYLKKFKVSTPR